MSENIAIALISSVSALTGVGISQLFERLRRKSEEHRWYANYFLPKKFDALYELYAQLGNSYNTVTINRDEVFDTKEECKRSVVDKINNYSDTVYNAAIYFDLDTEKLITEFQGSLKEAVIHISVKTEPIVITDKDELKINAVSDWPKSIDVQYVALKNNLSKKLNPSFLKRFESLK